MNRYQATPQQNGKYLTSVLPNIEVSPTDLYIFSREGDRLDALAFTFYGDTSLWWIIANANNLGKGSLIVPPGLQIRIPRNLGNLSERLNQLQTNR